MSEFLDLQDRLYHDYFQMKRYLLNQGDVKVQLYGSTLAFWLLIATPEADFKIDISNVCRLARKIRVNSAAIFAQSELLTITNAKYPSTSMECRQHSIPKGSSLFIGIICFKVKKPDRICFVDSAAASIQYRKHPFSFEICGRKT